MELKSWRELLSPYHLAVDEMVVKFNHLICEYLEKGIYSPILSVEGRVKKISSILDKVQKKGIDLDDFEKAVDDVAGVRLICQFVEDIEKVVQILRERQDVVIREEKDYISQGKPSGYRSYHMDTDYTVYLSDGPKTVKVEIQIRTLAMNYWGTVEHSLQYKYKGNMPEHIRERLLAASKAIGTLDKEMSSVRNEIMDAENTMQVKERVVSDILTNIQNLFGIANKREIVKIQDEFLKIYRLNELSKLERFNRELDVIVEGYRAQNL